MGEDSRKALAMRAVRASRTAHADPDPRTGAVGPKPWSWCPRSSRPTVWCVSYRHCPSPLPLVTSPRLACVQLDDVRKIRTPIVRLLQLSEDQAAADADKAEGEQAYLRLVEGQPGWIAGWQLGEAKRRRDDARLLRKSIEADLNTLELQLLQGDPSLAFIRLVLRSTRPEVVSQSLWLQEQFDTGALPRDPELLRTLLAQVVGTASAKGQVR